MRLINSLDAILLTISKVALIGLMGIITLDTCMRYFFSSPITGSDVIASDLLMVIVIFLSLSYVSSVDGQIKITFIKDRLPIKVNKFNSIVFNLMAFAFWGVIFYQYFFLSVESYQKGIQASIGFVIPEMFPYTIISIGTFLLLIRLIVNLVLVIQNWNNYKTEG